MARKSTRKGAPSPDAEGMFSGMHAVLIQDGVQVRRLEIWKNKLMQMGASVEDNLSRKVSHLFAMNYEAIREHVDDKQLSGFKGKILSYQWLEDSLRLGEKVSEDLYELKPELTTPEKVSDGKDSQSDEPDPKKRRSLSDPRDDSIDSRVTVTSEAKHSTASEDSFQSMSPSMSNQTANEDTLSSSNPYHPPDLNRNITEIFGKLINIYRALGDDRRSFSYYKAIPVIEKVPFKIESVDQVQDLPTIGKSLKDHIQEIVTTGKLSKLEHFETDEKVKAISLFGEVWGIGPATAMKLYEKGYRTLEDLKNEPSLTHAQQLGLKYFKDIQTRISRHDVQEMEQLLQKTGKELLPGVVIICGGSYRRGKSSCGDMDIVITHPDGKSHKGFLQKFVKRLKELNFLREDLVFSTHSEEGTDSGVDTYFGLCTYPGRELRHRIDFKVYPRDIYAFGLIAWTGNDVLNRRLRIIADSKGYRLDDTGLFLASQNSGGKRISKGRSLSLKTEKEVFDFLGFPWLEPHERNL